VIERALKSVRFSVDPQAATYPTLLKHAVSTGTVKDGNIDGLFDLTLVNQILSAAGADTVSAHKLGKE